MCRTWPCRPIVFGPFRPTIIQLFSSYIPTANAAEARALWSRFCDSCSLWTSCTIMGGLQFAAVHAHAYDALLIVESHLDPRSVLSRICKNLPTVLLFSLSFLSRQCLLWLILLQAIVNNQAEDDKLVVQKSISSLYHCCLCDMWTEKSVNI